METRALAVLDPPVKGKQGNLAARETVPAKAPRQALLRQEPRKNSRITTRSWLKEKTSENYALRVSILSDGQALVVQLTHGHDASVVKPIKNKNVHRCSVRRHSWSRSLFRSPSTPADLPLIPGTWCWVVVVFPPSVLFSVS